MATIRHETRELQFKIVYFGATDSGKTTNLQYIHRRLDPHLRSDLFGMSSCQNRLPSFDYLPVHTTEIPGYRMRFRLKVVSHHEGARRGSSEVITDADGVVFVSDSDPDRFPKSVNAHHSLCRALEAGPRPIPLVYQYNKRDLHAAVQPDVLDEVYGVNTPSFLACAQSGYQVFATLDHLVESTVACFSGVEAVNIGSEKVQVAVGSA